MPVAGGGGGTFVVGSSMTIDGSGVLFLFCS